MRNQQQNMAAIYCRLSRDDGNEGESNSIGHQRDMLRQYAKDHGIVVRGEYIDDGISGTTFERDGFKRMVADIEAGKVNAVLCKDLSRLGRNNAMVAFYTEIFFPENDIQFIAVNDGIDSARGENEIMGFKSIINEYYARDISKKIRSTMRTMALKGEFIGSQAPYGYMKDPEDKHRLVPDPETAPIVQRIFAMAGQGRNLDSIRRQLRSEEILTPIAYVARQTGSYQTDTALNYPTDWNRTTVYQILKKRVYLGHMVSQKQTTKSFKSKKVVIRPEDEWIEVQHTHEPLVEEKLFDKVQGLIQTKRRENVTHPENIFLGMLRCVDCGCTLTFNHNKPRDMKVYYCNLYRHSSLRCTAHSITLQVITATVLHDILKKAALAQEYIDDFQGYVQAVASDELANGAKSQQRELEQNRKRCAELNGIIKRLFEQNAAGMLTDERFMILSGDYETEQHELKKRIDTLENQLLQQKDAAEGLLQFQQIVSRYTDVTELSVNLLHELIDKIVVHESNGKQKKARRQKVEIHYRFVGVLPD